MKERSTVEAVAGRGLVDDRYYSDTGFYSYHTGPIREISLIEEETLAALERDHALSLAPGITRRNLVTSGISLNHLVDREFMVGQVRLRGVKLCEPCHHLVELTGNSSLLGTLIHRGGLHAQILSDGPISVGDRVSPGSASE